MPRQIESSAGVLLGQVSQRPQLAILLGTIASEWSIVEMHLAHLYGILLGSRHSKPIVVDESGRTQTSAVIDTLAMDIFDIAQNNHMRIRLLRTIAESMLSSADIELKELKSMVSALEEAAKQRNGIVHGLWGISSKYPESLVLLSNIYGSNGNFLVYDEPDFDQAISSISRAARLIQQFGSSALEFLGKNERAADPEP